MYYMQVPKFINVGSGPGSNSSLLLFGFWDEIFGGPGLTSGEGSETRSAGRDMRTVVKPMSECLGFHIKICLD